MVEHPQDEQAICSGEVSIVGRRLANALGEISQVGYHESIALQKHVKAAMRSSSATL